MIFIMCKWIRFYQIKSIDFCILTYIFKQGGGNATSPIFRCNRKANDGFDFFTVVRYFFCKIKIDVIVRFFIIRIAPSNNLSLNIC